MPSHLGQSEHTRQISVAGPVNIFLFYLLSALGACFARHTLLLRACKGGGTTENCKVSKWRSKCVAIKVSGCAKVWQKTVAFNVLTMQPAKCFSWVSMVHIEWYVILLTDKVLIITTT